MIDTDDYSVYVLIPYEEGHDPSAGVGTWNGVANVSGQSGFPTKEAAMRYCEDTIQKNAELPALRRPMPPARFTCRGGIG